MRNDGGFGETALLGRCALGGLGESALPGWGITAPWFFSVAVGVFVANSVAMRADDAFR